MGRNANSKVDKLLGYGLAGFSYRGTEELLPTHCQRCHRYKWIREIREMNESHKSSDLLGTGTTETENVY